MRRAASVAVVVTLATAACSNDDGKPATTTTSASTTTTATTAPPTTTSTALSADVVNAADARGLAAIIDRAAATIAAPPSDASLTAAALDQQLAYRRMARDPALEKSVTALLAPALRASATANVAAARDLIALSPPKNPTPPAAWRIVTPAPADELLGYYRAAEQEFGVPWTVLAAVHLVETRMGRIRGDSSAGAKGPMQFLPSTWKAYGEGDIESNKDSIRAAARYLKANGAPERLADALFRYNRSDRYVRAVTAYHQQMAAPNAYRAYHQWQVVYRTTNGARLLPEGWPDVPAKPVAE